MQCYFDKMICANLSVDNDSDKSPEGLAMSMTVKNLQIYDVKIANDTKNLEERSNYPWFVTIWLCVQQSLSNLQYLKDDSTLQIMQDSNTTQAKV